MKKIGIIFSFAFLISANIFAQTTPPMNSFGYEFLSKLKSTEITRITPQSKFVIDYDLIYKEGSFYVGVAALVKSKDFSNSSLRELNGINDTRIENLYTFRIPIENFESFLQLKGLEYVEISAPVLPELKNSLPSARVDSVHAGLGGLLKSYTGKGVIVAIIDWGFDYTHPNFYDTAFSRTRIIRAWDQNKTTGPAPQGYSFGTEYIGVNEILAAQTDTLYVFGPISHGTHVAGIAGGNGAGTPHLGVAFESELIFVSLKRDAPSFLDALSYITNYAAEVGKPYVVNMSFGSHLGPHDGSSLKNLGIDLLHGPGKIFVGSAGNNGNNNFHLSKNFAQTPGDTLKTVVNFTTSENYFGQTLSMWGSANSSFKVSFALVNSSFQIVHQTPFYHSLEQPLIDEINIVNSDTFQVRIAAVASHYLNQKPNIRAEVKNKTGLRMVMFITSNDSEVHIWNNVRLNNRYTNWGVDLSNNFPGAVGGNSDYGLGEPAGVGRNVITVGSYSAEIPLPIGGFSNGFISGFSSKGPTVDGRTKPDISSTGQGVISSINSFNISENPTIQVEFNDKIYGFRAYSGTSMSSPTVAGIIALMLEANPKLSATKAKEIIRSTARLDIRTGEIGPEGHLQWGWGKANALAAVLAAEHLTSFEEAEILTNRLSIFPNPNKGIVQVKINELRQINESFEISIYNLSGNKVFSQNITTIQDNTTLNLSMLTDGMYLIQIKLKNTVYFEKLQILK